MEFDIDEYELFYQNDMEAATEALENTDFSQGIEATKAYTEELQPIHEDSLPKIETQELPAKRFKSTYSVYKSIPSSNKISPPLGPENTQKLLRRPDKNTDNITCTLSSGERYFIRVSTKYSFTKKTYENKHLLENHVNQMLRQLEQDQMNVVIEQNNDSSSAGLKFVSDGCLWMDKYKPTKFIELLSEDKINRAVLRWIKSWDAFVFPHKRKQRTTPKFSDKQDHISESAMSNDFVDLRPDEKILLLCGPPGSGKTTLAKIVAKHAGYNPIEINASDDRTGSVLQQKIVNSMEMSCIWGERKPNCIILDEIDGAMSGPEGRGAMSVIMDLVKSPLATKKSKRSTRALTRPLICICNDQYVPALRSLRAVAKIYLVQPPSQQRISNRLQVICANENVRASSTVLSTLCDRVEYDIRYSLNALQLASMNASSITLSNLNKVLGNKDQMTTVFDLWDTVFYQRKRIRSSDEIEFKRGSFQLFQSLMNNASKHEVALCGLRENVLHLLMSDPSLSKTTHSFDWIEFGDICLQVSIALQDFTFYNYIPTAACGTHLQCCGISRNKISYPKQDSQIRANQEQTKNIIFTFIDGAQLLPTLRIGIVRLQLDVISWLLSIISPPIDPKQPHHGYQAEVSNSKLKDLLQLLNAFGISFRSKSKRPNGNGQAEFEMDPPLHRLCSYQGLSSVGKLPDSVLKLINREMELERMRGNEKHVAPARTIRKTKAHNEMLNKRNPYAHAFKHIELKKAEKLGVNPRLKKYAIRYKYQQGYTCGIKRPVCWNEFI